MEGLAVRSVEEIHEPIDPRFHLTSELDLAAHNFPHHHHGHGEASEETTEKTSGATTSTRSGTKDLEGFEEPLYVSAWSALCSRAPQVPYPIPQVDWEDGDPRNPVNFSRWVPHPANASGAGGTDDSHVPRRKKWLITAMGAFFTLSSGKQGSLSAFGALSEGFLGSCDCGVV